MEAGLSPSVPQISTRAPRGALGAGPWGRDGNLDPGVPGFPSREAGESAWDLAPLQLRDT